MNGNFLALLDFRTKLPYQLFCAADRGGNASILYWERIKLEPTVTCRARLVLQVEFFIFRFGQQRNDDVDSLFAPPFDLVFEPVPASWPCRNRKPAWRFIS